MNGNTLKNLGLFALVLVVITSPVAAHAPVDVIWGGSPGTVTDSSPYTSPSFNTSSGEKPDHIELDASNVTGNGTVELQKYNGTGFETVDTYTFSSGGEHDIDVAGTETYEESNEYRIKLTAEPEASYDADNLALWASIENDGPEADAGADQTAVEGDDVTFDASGSMDPNGDSLTYEWDYNNDGEYSGTGVSPTHTFYSEGTYHVNLLVTDQHGATSTDTVTITVEKENTNSAPNADAGPNQTAQPGDNVTFDGSASSDPDGDNFTHEWDFDGDGTVDATGVNPVHSFASSGDYTVHLTVTDENDATSTDTVTISVSESSYDVDFTVVDNSTAVENASIVVKDDSDGSEVANLTSDSTGSAVTSLEDGNYSYVISADGYSDKSGEVVVNGAAESVSEDFADGEDSGGTPLPGSGVSYAVIAILVLLAGAVALGSDEL
jgi:PKD repeat protein